MNRQQEEALVEGALAKQLADELALLARVRHRLELKLERFPMLSQRADAQTVEGIFDLVERATEDLDDATSSAARCLLADEPQRWSRNLKERSTEAATLLGIGSYHTFRDRRSGTSPSDDLMMAVARSVAEVSVSVVGPEDVAARRQVPIAPMLEVEVDPRDSVESGEASSDVGFRRNGVSLVVGLLLALVCGTAAFLLIRGLGDADGGQIAEVESSPGATEENAPEATLASSTEDSTVGASQAIPVSGCDIPLGGSATPVSDQSQIADAISAGVAEVGGIEQTGCPVSGLERWQSVWIQAFEGQALPPGSVVVSDAAEAVWVEAGVLIGYRDGMSGSLQSVSGLPVGFRSEGDVQILELADGAVVVAEVPGSRAFWIAAEASDDWLATGGPSSGLGPPLTDPNFIDGRPEQHFRHGRIWEGEPGEAVIEIVDDATVSAYLEQLGEPQERLVRSFDSTAWWIDENEVRHWVPDGETWHCLGGSDVLLEPETPGWVIGSFVAGAPITCTD